MEVTGERLAYLKKDAIQGFIKYIGLKPGALQPGKFVTRLKLEKRHLQQDGFAHAGILATMADHTAGYASYTLIPEDRRILTMEYKINYLRPAKGEFMECRARVIKPGKQVLVTEADVYAVNGKTRTLVARAMHTMASVPQGKIARAGT